MGVWKTIRKDWESIRSRSHFIVKNGRKVKFWKDLWCEDQTLKMFSLICSDWRSTRMSGCLMLGRKVERWVVRILCFQDTLTIEKWKRWRVCSGNSILLF